MSDQSAPQQAHTIPFEHSLLHDEKVTRDGSGVGSCLWRHPLPGQFIPGYAEGHSCSYRWQAHKTCIDRHRAIFDDIDESRVPSAWSRRIHTDGAGIRTLHGIPLPRRGDWDLIGPKGGAERVAQLKTIHVGRKGARAIVNFVTSAQWPYPFNAHHLVPRGVLANGIRSAAAQATQSDPGRAGEIESGIIHRLMLAGYNLNHQRNMMILPESKTVAAMLGLPRHLTKRPTSKAESGIVTAEPMSHAKYDKWVRGLLEQVFADMAEQVKQCQSTSLTVQKEKLEHVSDECRKEILAFGSTAMGLPLAAMKVTPKAVLK